MSCRTWWSPKDLLTPSSRTRGSPVVAVIPARPPPPVGRAPPGAAHPTTSGSRAAAGSGHESATLALSRPPTGRGGRRGPRPRRPRAVAARASLRPTCSTLAQPPRDQLLLDAAPVGAPHQQQGAAEAVEQVDVGGDPHGRADRHQLGQPRRGLRAEALRVRPDLRCVHLQQPHTSRLGGQRAAPLATQQQGVAVDVPHHDGLLGCLRQREGRRRGRSAAAGREQHGQGDQPPAAQRASTAARSRAA